MDALILAALVGVAVFVVLAWFKRDGFAVRLRSSSEAGRRLEAVGAAVYWIAAHIVIALLISGGVYFWATRLLS